jgi:hypothetical protein
VKPRTIERIEVFPTRLPVVKTFQFACGSAGTAGGTAPHVFVRVTDSQGEIGWCKGRSPAAWSYETLETASRSRRPPWIWPDTTCVRDDAGSMDLTGWKPALDRAAQGA